jgi:thymidylate synthase
MIYAPDFFDFESFLETLWNVFRVDRHSVEAKRWQSSELPQHENFKMIEVNNISANIILKDNTTLEEWQRQIKPNLPFADLAFEERVEGMPWNPGTAWQMWPWANKADEFRREGDRFSHSYAERYWPKEAGLHTDLELRRDVLEDSNLEGVRYPYGDLQDLVNLLKNDPLTRQGYLPVWFPEDTGVVHGERVPCTLGYHFLRRRDQLSVTYYIRSCDLYRHLRDDLYMTLRLLIWLKDQLEDPTLRLGTFTFNCINLHCFQGDYQKLKSEMEEKSDG